MKIKSVIFNPVVRVGLTSLILAIGLNSCNTIWTDQDACPEGASIRFVYDYNMEFADAFNKKVDCLSVLVFDNSGNHITTIEETSEALKDESYRMTLDLEPGDYTLVTYGGLACEESSFNIPSFGTRVSGHISGLYAEMEHDNFVSNDAKHDFYHGIHNLTIRQHKVAEETVYLKKNTNNIRIVLQQISGETITADQFTFSITDDNSYMDAENNVIPKGIVNYQPWTSGDAIVGTAEDGETPVSTVFAEFSTSRLTTGTSPKLVIRSIEKDKDIINIPLNQYLLLLKSEIHEGMESQEFLDRESEWSLVFFLDSGFRWINTHIVVNDWTVRLNHIGL